MIATNQDAIEYDLLMDDGFGEEVEAIADVNDDDLEELLNEAAEADAEFTNLENAEQANDPYAEWDESGTVGYENEDQTPEHSIKVNFDSLQDMREFRRVIDQDFTLKTESIYYPEKETETFDDRSYVMEDAGDD